MSTPAVVKLHYFCATGRANQIRLALAAAGIPFEDEFADGFPASDDCKAKWSALTNNNTTFSVPILTIDEGNPEKKQKTYIQSGAILRKVGRMGNLTLKLDDDDDQATYLQDRFIADAEDLRTASYKAFTLFGATKESADAFIHQIFPKHVENLERQLVDGGGDYFGGSSSLSIADVAVYDAMVTFGTQLTAGIPDVENPCGPALTAWIERVESNEGIANYWKSDQFADIAMKFDKSILGY